MIRQKIAVLNIMTAFFTSYRIASQRTLDHVVWHIPLRVSKCRSTASCPHFSTFCRRLRLTLQQQGVGHSPVHLQIRSQVDFGIANDPTRLERKRVPVQLIGSLMMTGWGRRMWRMFVIESAWSRSIMPWYGFRSKKSALPQPDLPAGWSTPRRPSLKL